jgi:hypothetical protein
MSVCLLDSSVAAVDRIDSCYGADDDELVVPLRLGDGHSDVESAQHQIDEYLAKCTHQITKAVVSAVLHYGFNILTNTRGDMLISIDGKSVMHLSTFQLIAVMHFSKSAHCVMHLSTFQLCGDAL